MIIKTSKIEVNLIPRTKKVIELTKKTNAKNLSDLIFNALYDGDLEILATLIYSFAENSEGKNPFENTDEVYEFIDKWVEENKKGYEELFRQVIEVVNEMGFLKKKMTDKDLKQAMESQMPIFDLKDMMTNTAQKIVDELAVEEFKGYKG